VYKNVYINVYVNVPVFKKKQARVSVNISGPLSFFRMRLKSEVLGINRR
jgi:hypothetical protein